MDTIISANISISGLCPIIMHNGQTADPFNQFSKAMKRLSGKRNKTDEDLMVLGNLEWWAGLYTSEPATIAEDSSVSIDSSAKVVIPAHVLDSCLREGARKSKLGKLASAGAIVEGDGEFIHDGPNDINKISNDGRFESRFPVKVGQAKVIRSRPIFPVWEANFNVQIDASVIEIDQVKLAMDNAGKLVGIGDWRPGAPRGGSYGRFVVEDISVNE